MNMYINMECTPMFTNKTDPRKTDFNVITTNLRFGLAQDGENSWQLLHPSDLKAANYSPTAILFLQFQQLPIGFSVRLSGSDFSSTV